MCEGVAFILMVLQLLDMFPKEAKKEGRVLPYLTGRKILASFKKSRRDLATKRIPYIQDYMDYLIRSVRLAY